MAYKFKKRKTQKAPPIYRARVRLSPNVENLTGFVRGFRASDIEERFANALRLYDIPYWFQYSVQTQISLPDQDRRLDFVVFYSPAMIYPVEIYGERWHASAGDQMRDLARREEIDARGREFSPPWQPVQVVWGKELATQSMANQKVRGMFI